MGAAVATAARSAPGPVPTSAACVSRDVANASACNASRVALDDTPADPATAAAAAAARVSSAVAAATTAAPPSPVTTAMPSATRAAPISRASEILSVTS